MRHITLTNPEDARKFYPGMPYTLARPAWWWRRAWAWIVRRVLRRRPVMLVTEVDYERGIVTIGSGSVR